MYLNSIILQAQANGGGYKMFIMLGLMVVIFYFFMIRPQSKKAKEQKKFRESLGKGAKIVTIGGIHGKIVDVKETTFIIEVESGVRLKIEKTAVSADIVVKEETAISSAETKE